MKKIVLSALSLFVWFGASAQQITLKKADIPRVPTDTLPTDREEVRIVTFADGTFRFIPADPEHLPGLPPYRANWDTLNLFAYRDIELGDLPERIPVEMAKDHGFRAPATGRILSKYGPRGRSAHNGIDIAVAHGTPVFAAFDGIVRFSRWNSGGFGNIVIVRHASGLETWYAHLSRRAVTAGEWVGAGGVIGYAGRTGRATTDHLHFEVRYSDQSFDPERIIDFERGALRQTALVLRKEYFSIRSRAVEGIEEDPDAAPSVDPPAPAAGVDSLAAAEPPQPAEPEPVFHKIKSGDTLLALALGYKTTVAKICALNGITRTSTLRIGRNLRIK
jgi:LysM repeat protein/ribosomal protein L27